MMTLTRYVFGVFLVAATFAATAAPKQNPDWSRPRQPFRVYGNTWYVGTYGLGAILITSPHGHVLIDGTLESNAPQIEANIRKLGFRVGDIRAILNSHAHSDHAGAIAALSRDSGATVYASAAGARALEVGGADREDPQYGMVPLYPSVSRVRIVADGETVHVADIAIVAHYTPGHTPGSTSWTWNSCAGNRCHSIAYVDSVVPISRTGYRFSDDERHPRRTEDFRHSLAVIAALPCDLLVTPHPDASDFMDKVARRDQGAQPDPLIDPRACVAYAAEGTVRLDARLAREQKNAP
ncbi:MAG: subclass B3 metallo-beta-lactamase [Rhodanobacter sp.]